MERLELEEKSLALEVDGRTLALPGPLRDAWRHDGVVLVMAKVDGALMLILYDEGSLAERHRVAAPEGFVFDRLTRDVRGDASAIGWTPNAIHGHNDWQFAIDLETGALTRTDPSH